MNVTRALAVFIFFSSSLSAVAQERPYYFRADLGVSAPTKVNLSNSPNLGGLSLLWQEGGNGSPPKRFQLDSGPMVSGAVGWRVAPGWRLEGALTYRQHEMNETSRVPGNTFIEYHKAKTDSLNAMLNGYRDFDLGWAVKPYLGAGIGFSRNRWLRHETERFTPPVTLDRRSERPNSMVEGAWSLAAGLQWKAGRLTWDAGYRYSDLGKIASEGLVPLSAGGISLSNVRLTGHMRAHEFTVGVLF